MAKVIIIGGGWAGCAAAITAIKNKAEVVLIEKTDMLLGCGLVGGIMRNNGRFTATEEAIIMGAGELFELADSLSRHKNIDFPGHSHASLYDVLKIEPAVRNLLVKKGVNILFETRAVDVEMDKNKITGILISDDRLIKGDVFIETTGSSGPMGNCLKYGNGCAMCIQRCPAYGPRVSISEKAGGKDVIGKRSSDSFGAMSGSCKLNKDSLGEEIRNKLNKEGVVIIPLDKKNINKQKLSMKVCQQYAINEYAENLILLDTGHAKLMTSYHSLAALRNIKGFENVRYEDPYAGSKGNSIRYMSMALRDNTMKVDGIPNLFCAGEKSGPFVGHTEAIVTGSLAGYNSIRYLYGEKTLELPRTTAIGDIIAYVNEQMRTDSGLCNRYTFAGALYFERMKKLNLYTTNLDVIKDRVYKEGLIDVFMC
jgi:hypothetical protein